MKKIRRIKRSRTCIYTEKNYWLLKVTRLNVNKGVGKSNNVNVWERDVVMKGLNVISNILILLIIATSILTILDFIGLIKFPYSLSIVGLILILNYWIETKKEGKTEALYLSVGTVLFILGLIEILFFRN